MTYSATHHNKINLERMLREPDYLEAQERLARIGINRPVAELKRMARPDYQGNMKGVLFKVLSDRGMSIPGFSDQVMNPL